MYYYRLVDDEVREVSFVEWLFHFNERFLMNDEIGEHTVSTTFIGVCHIMFETMILTRDSVRTIGRANLKYEALRNHARAITGLLQKESEP